MCGTSARPGPDSTIEPMTLLENTDVDIRIGLPLPLAVTGALLEAIGAVWPDASIRTDGTNPTEMTVRITGPARELDDDALAALAGAAAHDDDDHDDQVELFLSQLRDGSFGIKSEEWVSKLFVGAFANILDQHPDATNYVEMSLHDPETGARYNVIVTRPGGASPHQLRAAAEARVAALEAQLRAAGLDPA